MSGLDANTAVLVVFGLVYLGMFMGGLPALKLDRTGVAVLGAIAMIVITGMPLEEAAGAVDLSTVVLLFSFMVISAQLRLGGFYAAVTRAVAGRRTSRPALIASLLVVAAVLSAVFSNDVVCLAMTPVLVRVCLQRGLAPVPFLVGLACAANIGSAATLIGNPQNMLIGSVLGLPFGAYLSAAWPPVLASLALLWLWLSWGPGAKVGSAPELMNATPPDDGPPFDPWQSAKGLVVAGALLLVFLGTEWPPAVAALVGAGALLLSRRLHSAQTMGLVDWPLLLLFVGLFVVNHALAQRGMADEAVAMMLARGVELSDPGTLLVLGVFLSNAVSNVPAVMLLLPHLGGTGLDGGILLALASTFAGNLLLVGSIANLIVADLAAKAGVPFGWREHAAIGVPVTLLSLLTLWVWVGLRA